ncbi:hypothetical protein GCM10025879_06450 [Leuconostoc litchii]|nr:hypothetical protein GCM10025879_06450 [Leuconostoc litchii]
MITLEDNINILPGVGPKRLDALHEIGIFTIEDLVNYFPFRYQDLGEKLPSETLDGEKATFKGIVSTPAVVTHFGKRSQTRFGLMVEHENIRVSFLINRGLLIISMLGKKWQFMVHTMLLRQH